LLLDFFGNKVESFLKE